MSYYIPQSIRSTACVLITLDELDRLYGVYYRGGRQFLIDFLEETQVGVPIESLYIIEECASVITSLAFTVYAYNQSRQDYISIYSTTHRRAYCVPEHKLIGAVVKTSDTSAHAISMTIRSMFNTDTSKLMALIVPRKYAE
jgi:hypothetical protein